MQQKYLKIAMFHPHIVLFLFRMSRTGFGGRLAFLALSLFGVSFSPKEIYKIKYAVPGHLKLRSRSKETGMSGLSRLEIIERVPYYASAGITF